MIEGVPDWSVVSAICFVITAPAVTLVFVVRSIITGKLVPLSAHQETVDERNDWKDLALTNQQTIHGQNETLGVQAVTIGKQAETGEAFTHLFDAIKAQAEGKP